MRLSLKESRTRCHGWDRAVGNPGSFAFFCEGWDTTNLATDRRVSHPLPRAQRMGHPPFRGASCRVKHQLRLNREFVSFQPVRLTPQHRWTLAPRPQATEPHLKLVIPNSVAGFPTAQHQTWPRVRHSFHPSAGRSGCHGWYPLLKRPGPLQTFSLGAECLPSLCLPH